MGIELTREQQAVVRSRGGELLVSAAAGSGKTRVLVERIVDRVEQEGIDLTRFLTITFTNLAAAELRSRILAELNRRLEEHGEQRHLRRQLSLVHLAQISTIHSFCTAFLRENSHLLDLDSDFRVAGEKEAKLLLLQTLDRVLERHYEEPDPEGFEILVDAFSEGRDDRKLSEIVLDLHQQLQALPEPWQWLRGQAEAFRWVPGTDAAQTPWGALLRKDAAGQVRYWHRQLRLARSLAERDAVLEQAYAGVIQESADAMSELACALEQGGWDEARSALAQLPFGRLGSARKVQDKAAQERVKEIWNQCKKAMAKLMDRFPCRSEQMMSDLAAAAPGVERLFDLVRELEEEFQRAKARRKLLDFNDLEHRTLAALVRDGEPTQLAELWGERYVEVLVDEYQDTNAVQNAIFDALTDQGRKLVQVGDVKQSIYRFRQADPTIFLHKYDCFPPAEAARAGEARKLCLSRNFRSRKAVLDAVNFLFSAILTRSFGEIDYTEDQRLYCGRTDGQEGGGVELDVVDLSTLERGEEEAALPRDQGEAQFVALRVRQLLEEGLRVPEGEGDRPLRPEDVAILYRSPGAVLPYLTAALDAQGVPWQYKDTGDLLQTTEVSVAMSFLEVIDNPREDVSLLSVLRSPVYAFEPDLLARLRARCPDTDLFGCVQAGAERGEERCRRFLRELEGLRVLMSDSTCAQLLWHLFDQVGLLGLFGAMSGGERRQENLLAFYDYARGFEQRGHRGLFAFVTHLRALAEQGEKLGSPRSVSGGAVRILSIHTSKGLEFPVVVLAGLNRSFNTTDERKSVLFHAKLGVGPWLMDRRLRIKVPTLPRMAIQAQMEREDRAEELRLLYVAMTRARERLVMVMTCQNAFRELNKLLPNAGTSPDPELLALQGSVAKWMLLPILCREDAEQLWREARPPVPLPCPDRWDIRLVQADEDCFAPRERHSRAAAAPTASAEGDEALLRALRWRYPDEGLALLPSKVTATQLKGRRLDEEAAEDTPRAASAVQPAPVGAELGETSEFRRPDLGRAGARKLTAAQAGSAIHAVMERIDVDKAAEPGQVAEEIARLCAQGHLTAEQAAAVDPEQVARFWASPLGRAGACSPDLRREFKFSILAPARRFYPDTPEGEQVLLQGVVDCCFGEPAGITVVDFKSDRVRPGAERAAAEQYRGQVSVYAAALSEIFDRPVTRRVVWFLRTGCAVELSQAAQAAPGGNLPLSVSD